MKPLLCLTLSIATALSASFVSNARAEDATVDQLIKKLPPPEKVAPTDPAARDPLVKKIVESIKAMNLGNAYAVSKQLAARYPKSSGAHALHGQLSLVLRHYSEASNAFGKAVAIQPNNAFAFVGLAMSEALQNHNSAAMSNFQKVARLQPNAEIGWIGMSACAEKLGRKGDSLQYARRATAVAPSSFAAWLQLSRAEGVAGNRQASADALKRANQLRRTTKTQRRS